MLQATQSESYVMDICTRRSELTQEEREVNSGSVVETRSEGAPLSVEVIVEDGWECTVLQTSNGNPEQPEGMGSIAARGWSSLQPEYEAGVASWAQAQATLGARGVSS